MIRMQNAINADHMSVLNPSADPFVNLDDMISRLLPFHVLQSPFHVDNPELQQIPDFAERRFFCAYGFRDEMNAVNQAMPQF